MTEPKKKTSSKKKAAAKKRSKPREKPKADKTHRSQQRELTHTILRNAILLGEECDASALLIYVDALADLEEEYEFPPELADRVIYVAKTSEEYDEQVELGQQVVRVPRVTLTRMGQVKVAMFLALSRGLLHGGDRVLALAGVAGSTGLDMVLVMEVGQEFETFLGQTEDDASAPELRPEVLARIVELAVDLGSEGREGRSVGTLFVVGDEDKVMPLTRQRILNPFHGYPEDKRNVLDVELEETIKELSTVDGAFVVRGDGTVLSSGTYLKTTSLPEETLPRGLGARHQAAAGISAVTDCIAVAVSESTGTVSVFRKGRMVTQIEKPLKARPDTR